MLPILAVGKCSKIEKAFPGFKINIYTHDLAHYITNICSGFLKNTIYLFLQTASHFGKHHSKMKELTLLCIRYK